MLVNDDKMVVESPRARKPKYRIIEADLLSMIRDGRVKVGEQVPTESIITSKYNVSRFTVRKAIENLERAGYVDRNAGRGTFVANWRSRQADQMVLRKDLAMIYVDGDPKKEMDDSWGMRTLRVMSEEAEKFDYHVTFCGVDHNEINKGNIPLAIREKTVRGGIIDGELRQTLIERFTEKDMPLLILGSHDDYGIPSVTHDIKGMACSLTHELVNLNHGPVWYVAEQSNPAIIYMNSIYDGYKQAIFDCADEGCILHANFCDVSESKYVAKQMAGSGHRCHCVIVSEPAHLSRLLEGMKHEGLKREDVLFVGLGRHHDGWVLNKNEMMFCEVAPDEIAREAVRQLVANIENGQKCTGRKLELVINKVSDDQVPLKFIWK